jgi:hypothetical protein
MASGKGNTNALGYLKAVYQAVFTDLSTLWQNSGSSPATNLYVSLHTANPGATGTQSTSEATYGGGTGYARVAVSRASGAGGWTITSETITNTSAITFGACVGGSGETETYVGIGLASSGAGTLLWFGQLTTPLAVGGGVTPSIAASALSITEA